MMDKETIAIGIAITAIIYTRIVIAIFKARLDKKIKEVERKANGWNSNTNKVVTEAIKELLQLNLARMDDITKLREETPMLEITLSREAILHTRKGDEIYRKQLKKKQAK